MPLFNWPYTNLHSLNLDWIIKKIKNVETAETNTAASASSAKTSETNAAASQAAAAASQTAASESAASAERYYNTITENVGTLVTGWMDEHITPTTPPVDDTLTIQGAAADAKKTGDEVADLKNEINILNDGVESAVIDNVTNLIDLDIDNIVYDSMPTDLTVSKVLDTIEFKFHGTANLVAYIPVTMLGSGYITFKIGNAVNVVRPSGQSNTSNIRLFAVNKTSTLYNFGDLSTGVSDYSFDYNNNSYHLDDAYVRLWVGANGANTLNTLTIKNLFACAQADAPEVKKIINPDYIEDFVNTEVSPLSNSVAVLNNKLNALDTVVEYNYTNLLDFSVVSFTSEPSDLKVEYTDTSIKLTGTGQIIAWIPMTLKNGKNYYFKIASAKATIHSTNTNIRLYSRQSASTHLKEILKFSEAEYTNVSVKYPSVFNGGCIRIWTSTGTNTIELSGFWCVDEENLDEPQKTVIKSQAIGKKTLEVYGVQKYNSPYTIEEDRFSSYIRGIKFADELNVPFVDLKKDGDLMVHVSTFAIINDVLYGTYYANRTHATETPSEHIARFVHCPMNNPSNKTYVDLQSAGDTYDGKTVTAIYDTIMLHKDNDVLYLAWTAALNGVYTRLYRTYTISTGTLGDIQYNTFTVGETTAIFNVENMETMLEDIPHKQISGDIGIMQRLTSRTEGGAVYYYTGAYCGEWNAIIKSSDLINWVYVSAPTFECESQWENAVYVKGNKAYYFLRQKNTEPCGVLAYYDILNDEWSEPYYVYDCQSRSDFFLLYNVLYLVHAPKDRGHISIMRVNEDRLFYSYPVQTAYISNGAFYPFVQVYNNHLYMSYTQNREHIYISEFELLEPSNAAIMAKMKTLILTD